MSRIKFTLSFCFFFSWTICSAQDTSTLPGSSEILSLSIKECINYGTLNSSNTKVARLDENVSRQQTKEIRGRGLPQANITGNFEDRLKIPLLVIPGGLSGAPSGDSTNNNTGTGNTNTSRASGQGIPLGFKYNTSLVGEVTQMILDPSFWVGLKASKYSNLLASQTTQQVQEQTAYNITMAYYQSIVVEKQRQLLVANIASTLKLLDNTQLQFENGVAKRVDVNRLRVNANNLESQRKQAELTLVQSLNSLKFQMGMPLQQPIVLSDTAFIFTDDSHLLADSSDFTVNRIEYNLLQTNISLQNLDRQNTISGYYPTLTGYANYGYQAQGAKFGFFKTENNKWVDYNTSALGLRLRLPVFDGLQRNSRVQQSKIKILRLEENLRLTKQNINLQVANAQTTYRNTLERISAEQQNVALAQEVYQVSQLEFREGVGTSSDVVNSETFLRQAQNTYIRTLLDLYIARLDLERARGTLISYLNSGK